MLGGAAVAGDFDIAAANLKGAYLDMQRASVGTLRGEPKWPKAGKLLLDGFSYERLAGAPTDASYCLWWLRLQRSPTTNNSFSPQPYRHIAKVLREQGHEAEAQDVLIGLEDDRREYGRLNREQRAWGFVSKWTIAYGYRPLRALWSIAIFVLLGFLVFEWAYQSGELVPSDKEAYDTFAQVPTGHLPSITTMASVAASGDASMPMHTARDVPKRVSQLPGSYEGFCALVYSIDTFVPIIDLGQRSRWKPIDRPEDAVKLPKPSNSSVLMCVICDPSALTSWLPSPPVGLVLFFRWVYIVLGWIFTVLFAAGVSGLVRRD